MKRLLKYWISASLIVGLSLAISACSSPAKPTPAPLPTVPMSVDPTPTPAMTEVDAADGGVQYKFHLSQNGSQQEGTLTLTQLGDATQLVIQLQPAAPVGQPVSMRHGTCDNPTGYVRDLDAVVGGFMTQKLLDFPIGEFAKGDLTILVSPGFGTLAQVSACAEIPDLHRPDLPGYSSLQ